MVQIHGIRRANALTWTPPNAQEMQRSMMMRYRGESTGDNMQH